MDLERFQQDLDAGIYFDSSIPQGFGVGSSGAVVAAIYDRYALNKPETETFNQAESLLHLKMVFAKLESYFHGKSSGLDPLICYLNLPVLIRSREDLGTVGLPTENNTGKGGIFLLDTGAPGKTSSMVSIFLEKLKHEGFRNMIRQQLVKYNDECIKAFLNRDAKPLFYNLKELSKLFLENFRPMIPDSFEKLWKDGIESNAYFLKLCGSGGGGFILGFTQDLEEAKQKLAGHNMEVIYRF
jgi:mevalonate kinase